MRTRTLNLKMAGNRSQDLNPTFLCKAFPSSRCPNKSSPSSPQVQLTPEYPPLFIPLTGGSIRRCDVMNKTISPQLSILQHKRRIRFSMNTHPNLTLVTHSFLDNNIIFYDLFPPMYVRYYNKPKIPKTSPIYASLIYPENCILYQNSVPNSLKG